MTGVRAAQRVELATEEVGDGGGEGGGVEGGDGVRRGCEGAEGFGGEVG